MRIEKAGLLMKYLKRDLVSESRCDDEQPNCRTAARSSMTVSNIQLWIYDFCEFNLMALFSNTQDRASCDPKIE
jgi:hypothetical protein